MESQSSNGENLIQQQKNCLIQFSVHLMDVGLPQPLLISLIIIETLQFIAMGLVTPLKYSSVGLELLRQILSFFYPHAVAANIVLARVLIFVIFLLAIFHCSIFIYSFYKFQRKQKNRLSTMVHFLFIFSTIVTAPAILLSLTSFSFCDSSCTSALGIITGLMAIVVMIWIILSTLYQLLFYINRNPLEINYFTCSSTLWMTGKFLIKLAPPIYLIADPELQFDVLYIVSLVCLNAGYLIIFRFMWPYYRSHQAIETFILRCETFTTIILISYIPLHFISSQIPNNCIFIFSSVLGIFIGSFLVQLYRQKKNSLRIVYIMGQFAKEQIQQMTELFYTIIEEIEKSKGDIMPVLLDLLQVHNSRCSLSQCTCHTLLCSYKKFDYALSLQQIYQSLICLLNELKDKYKNHINLLIVEGYIQYYRLGGRVKAISTFSREITPKTEHIETIAIQSLIYAYHEDEKKLTALMKYRQFSENLWKFEELLQKSSIKCQQYWRQLIQQDCEITKLCRMAKSIEKSKVEIINFLKDSLLSIFPNNIYIKRLFLEMFIFVYRVPFEEVEEYFLEYERGINEEVQQVQKITFRQNSQMTVFCCIEEQENFIFISISTNVSGLLGYKNSQLEKQPLNTIIPKPLKQLHDKKLEGYFIKEDNQINGRSNAAVFALHKSGVFLQCLYETKILPSLEYGLELVGFMKEIKKKNQAYFYISYYKEEKKEEEESQIKSSLIKQRKNGRVAVIDKELIELLELEMNRKHSFSINELIPNWNIVEQKFCSSFFQGDEEIIKAIDVVDSIQLSKSLKLKIIRITLEKTPKEEVSFFIPMKSKEVRRNSSGFQTLKVEKGTNLEEIKKQFSKQGASKPISNEYIKKQQQQGRIFTSFSYLLVWTIFLIVFIGALGCNISNFIVSLNIYSNINQDYKIIKTSSQLIEQMTFITINLNKLQTNISLLSSLQQQNHQKLQQVKQYKFQIYEILGFSRIDQEIQPILSILQEDNQTQTQKSTIFEGLSIYIANCLSYMNEPKYQYFYFVDANWIVLFQALERIEGISLSQMSKQVSANIILLYIFNLLELILLTILIVFIFFRHKKSSLCTLQIVQKYKNCLQICEAKKYEKECGRYTKLKNLSNAGKSDILLGEIDEKSFETVADKQAKCISEEDYNVNEDQFQKLKTKVSFQQKPSSKNKTLFCIIFTIVVFVVMRVLVIIVFDDRFKIQFHQNFRGFIETNLKIEKAMGKMFYYSYTKQDKFFEATNEIEGLILSLSLNNKFESNHYFKDYFQEFSKIINQNLSSIEYDTFFSELIALEDSMHLKIEQIEQKYLTSPQIFLPIIASALVLFLLLFLFHSLAIPSERLIKGCQMMNRLLGRT